MSADRLEVCPCCGRSGRGAPFPHFGTTEQKLAWIDQHDPDTASDRHQSVPGRMSFTVLEKKR